MRLFRGRNKRQKPGYTRCSGCGGNGVIARGDLLDPWSWCSVCDGSGEEACYHPGDQRIYDPQADLEGRDYETCKVCGMTLGH